MSIKKCKGLRYLIEKSMKEYNELGNLIDEISISDFDFTELQLKGRIICTDIKETPYLTKEGIKMHKVFVPKATVSPSQWDKEYKPDNCGFHYNYYNEYTDEVQYLYPWNIGYEIDMTDEEYNAFEALLDKTEYIETEAKIIYAEFINTKIKDDICKLKLFTDLITRLKYSLKGWTGETFFETRFGPLFTERNKVLNIIDNLKAFSESDKHNMVEAYKEFLHKEHNELEE